MRLLIQPTNNFTDTFFQDQYLLVLVLKIATKGLNHRIEARKIHNALHEMPKSPHKVPNGSHDLTAAPKSREYLLISRQHVSSCLFKL
jgi:hypothetical protein